MGWRFAIIIILLITSLGCASGQTIERHNVASTVSYALQTGDFSGDMENSTRIENNTVKIGEDNIRLEGTNNSTLSSGMGYINGVNGTSEGNASTPRTINISAEDAAEYIDALSENSTDEGIYTTTNASVDETDSNATLSTEDNSTSEAQNQSEYEEVYTLLADADSAESDAENASLEDGDIDITDGGFVDVSEGDYTSPPEGSHTSSGEGNESVIIGNWSDTDIIDINDTEVIVDNGTTDQSVTDGENITINGTDIEDSSGDGALPPSYNPPNANQTDPDTVNRVPNYSTPAVNTTVPEEDQNNETVDEIAKKKASERVSTHFDFQMEGRVTGNGSYSEWRLMKDSGGGRVKQSSGGKDGELELVRMDVALGEFDTYNSTWALLARSYVRFIGAQYRERDLYVSEGEYVKENFQTEAIRKQSDYVDFREFRLPNKEVGVPEVWLSNVTKTYNTDVRFVGTGSFCSKFSSSPAISDYYSGQFSISRRLSSYNSSRIFKDNSTWIPCCNWSDDPRGTSPLDDHPYF